VNGKVSLPRNVANTFFSYGKQSLEATPFPRRGFFVESGYGILTNGSLKNVKLFFQIIIIGYIYSRCKKQQIPGSIFLVISTLERVAGSFLQKLNTFKTINKVPVKYRDFFLLWFKRKKITQ
jgi:hypothetical protein